MKAIKKILEVGKDKSITVKPLPFKPGSKVEIIVLPIDKEDIFEFTDEIVKRKKVPYMSMKEVEKVVHEIRGIK